MISENLFKVVVENYEATGEQIKLLQKMRLESIHKATGSSFQAFNSRRKSLDI